MKCLTFDTTTDISSIAIADENGVIAEYNFAHHRDLSQRMMPAIMCMLKDSKMAMTDIQAVGTSLGPGSFTGLRMGVVTAKTLAQVLDIPLVGVTSLDLLAHQFDYLPNALVCPIIKIRKGEVYYAFYRTSTHGIERISGYEGEPVETLIAQARELSGSQQIIFCGDALTANYPTLKEALGDRAIAAPSWLSYPKASVLARVAIEKISAGQADDPLTLVPFYIRKSTPEIRLECSSSNK